MIQRIQSLYLLIAAVIYIILLSTSDDLFDDIFDANYNDVIVFFMFVSVILSISAIFSYKKRKAQLTLTYANILINTIILIFVILDSRTLKSNLFFILFVAMIILLFMTIKAIRKDEELVKSTDRLR